MKILRHIGIFLLIAFLCMDSQSCRKQYDSTAEDMTEYGWVLYEQEDYLSSNDWFRQAVDNDTTWKEGYNGLGWSYGKLMVLDSSILYFSQGLDKEQNVWDTTDTHADILAGLTFSNHAQGNDRKAIYYGDSLLTRTEKPLEPHWAFSHDSLLNYLDVRITLAAAYFAKGIFDSTILQVTAILDSILSNAVAVTDTTLLGREKMAEQIAEIQSYLLTH